MSDLNRCTFKPNEGADAQMTKIGNVDIQDSGFFGKKMNASDLRSVYSASVEATIRYAQGIGLNVYRTPYRTDATVCPSFESLSFAPTHLQDIWNAASGGVGEGATLLGLYFDYACLPPEVKKVPGTPGCQPTKTAQPTILVIEATDKWSLVHEMMHHNFKKTVKESGAVLRDEQLAWELKKAVTAFQKAKTDYEAVENRDDLEVFLVKLKLAVGHVLETISRGKLEETAIEGLLIKLWTEGELGYVTTTDSSVWYMGVGADEARGSIPDVKALTDFARKEAEKHFWPEYKVRADEIDAMVADFAKNIDESIETARRRLDNHGVKVRAKPDGVRALALPNLAAIRKHIKNHENPVLEKARVEALKGLAL